MQSFSPMLVYLNFVLERLLDDRYVHDLPLIAMCLEMYVRFKLNEIEVKYM